MAVAFAVVAVANAAFAVTNASAAVTDAARAKSSACDVSTTFATAVAPVFNASANSAAAAAEALSKRKH